MTTNRKPKIGKDDRDQQIKSLEKEILRKDKALAEASAQGCRQAQACEVVGIASKTYQRWALKPVLGDLRRGPLFVPANKLTPEERAKIVAVSSHADFVNLSPHQIIPRLADRGEYVGSESSFYRILHQEQMMAHRGRAKPPERHRPVPLMASSPNQLFSWDITYLPSGVRGQYFYLYLFMDLFSRKIVGWEVHAEESMELSSKLLQKICEQEGISKNQLHLHSDNGGPMKGATMLVTMQWLGVVPSFSRPSVSNDNAFSESLFRTLKYCPKYPSKPFENIEAARRWVGEFVHWYNTQHLHSGINFVTPGSKHQGEDVAILQKRDVVYLEARERNPNRWSGKTRDWSPVKSVNLNHLRTEKNSITKDQLSKSS